MDLKHVEELAKDKYIMQAYIVSCFLCYDPNYDVYGESSKAWKDLIEDEKLDLINNAEYFYLKDYSGASLGRICDIVMRHQKEILEDSMDKSKFFEILADYGCN